MVITSVSLFLGLFLCSSNRISWSNSSFFVVLRKIQLFLMILEAGKSNIKVLASGKGFILHLHSDGGCHMAIELLRGEDGNTTREEAELDP